MGKEMKDLGLNREILLACSAGRGAQTQKRPARSNAAGRPVISPYADFFRSVGNARIFPRCSGGTHFTLGLKRVGM